MLIHAALVGAGVLSALTHLKISDNSMLALSEDIKGLVSLTHLDARNNKIGSISSEIRNLTALTELLLDKNQLHELPPSLALCSRSTCVSRTKKKYLL